jgi:hypothetical protein
MLPPSYDEPNVGMTNENFARLLRGLTLAVGNRTNRILLYRFIAAEIRALHCSYGIRDQESYKRALRFLEIASDIRCAVWSAGRPNSMLR